MVTQDMSQPDLSRQTRITYGLGDSGLNVFWQGVGFYLLFFLTDIMGISNTDAGIILLVGGLIDTVTDPIMGVLADRTRSRWGRYRPYMLFGSIPLAICFVLLFHIDLIPLRLEPAATLLCILIAFRIAYTIVSIPYSSLGARLSYNAEERTRIAGTRMICGALGGIGIIALISGAREILPDSVAFHGATLIAGVIGAALIIGSALFTEINAPPKPSDKLRRPNQYSLGQILNAVFNNAPFLILIAAIASLTLAHTIFVNTLVYRFDHLLDAQRLGGVTLPLVAATPLIAIPVWVRVYLKFDKRPAFIMGAALIIAAFLALAFLGKNSAVITAGLSLVIAFGYSSFAVGFWSVLPDTIDYGHRKLGYRIESGLIGLASALQKLSIAIAGFMTGIALDAIGYSSQQGFTEDVGGRFHYVTTLPPALFMLICVLIFSAYPLSSRSHAEIVDTLTANGEEE